MMNPSRRLAGLLLAASGAILAVCPVASHAAPPAPPVSGERLSLFSIDLASASVAQFQGAARAAGAKSQGRKGPAERFDVAALGIPAVKSLTVTYAGDRVMAAQYEVDYQNETLRKMLKSKYGNPSASRGTSDFAAEYVGDGSYVWRFPAGMQLVFKRPFFVSEPTTLTYLNADLFAAVEGQAKGRDDRDAAEKAKAKSNVF